MMTIDNYVILTSTASSYIPTKVSRQTLTYFSIADINEAVSKLSSMISSIGPDYEEAL